MWLHFTVIWVLICVRVYRVYIFNCAFFIFRAGSWNPLHSPEIQQRMCLFDTMFSPHPFERHRKWHHHPPCYPSEATQRKIYQPCLHRSVPHQPYHGPQNYYRHRSRGRREAEYALRGLCQTWPPSKGTVLNPDASRRRQGRLSPKQPSRSVSLRLFRESLRAI